MRGRWDTGRKVLVLLDDNGQPFGETPVGSYWTPIFDRAAGGDAEAQRQVQTFSQGAQQHLEGGQQQGEGEGYLVKPEVFSAAATQINTADAYRQSLGKLADAEAAMVAEMQQAGVDPSRFFSSSPSAGSVANLPMSNLAAVAIANGPDYAEAFGALDRATAGVDITTRTQQLAEIGRQWQAAKVGIDRMEKLRSARTEIEDTERAYADAEAQASKDIGQDRNLVPITNADGSVSWSHSGNAGTRRALDRAKAEYQRMQETWYPEQMRAVRQNEVRGQVKEAMRAGSASGGLPALAPHQWNALFAGEPESDTNSPEYRRMYGTIEPLTAEPPKPRRPREGLTTEYALGGRTGEADVIPAPRRSSGGGHITITIAVPAGGGGGGVNAVTSPPRPRPRLATGGRVARYQEGGTPELTGFGATGPGVVASEAKREEAERAQNQRDEQVVRARAEIAQQRQTAENRHAQAMAAAQMERQQAVAQAQQRAASQQVSAAVQGARNPFASVGPLKVG